jgi:putative acetyltransferase
MDRFETAAHREIPDASPAPPGIAIRAARASDAASFRSFWAAIVAEDRYVRSDRITHPVREYRRRFRRPWTDAEAQLMAVQDGRVVGHLYLQRERHAVTHHVATLGVAVAADVRGLGVGSALMAEGMRWAHDVGVHKLVLSVYPHNRSAIALYRKFGFMEEGRLARQSLKSYGYEDELLMGAWIGGPTDERGDGR